ncbi:MAG TPA: DUF1611 domain-containing protein [Usitatibacter sp.]|nr:DUF1611 domain-containing protein [Usitatibacter sp.]
MPVRIHPLDAHRVARAKRAYATRRVNLEQATGLLADGYGPRAGDVVLARVEKIGQHKRLELVTGRRADLHEGDEIVVCYGNRYAPDQFEAEVGLDLSPCDLAAAGGIAAKCLSRHAKMQPATRIAPVGVLAHRDGTALNLEQFGLEPRRAPPHRPPVTAVVGTSMNAGKTTTAAHFALGLSRQGFVVGAAKVTGTGAGCDPWQMVDAGCVRVLDFTDCGYASTYLLEPGQCVAVLETLIAHLCEDDPDAIVLEVADGVLQRETRALVGSPTFSRLVDHVIFSADDAMGAAAGVAWCREQRLDVIGVSGVLTAAPLAMRECAELVDVPVLDAQTLKGGRWLPASVARQRRPRAA